MRALVQALRCRRGNAAIEFALIAPVFLALIVGVMEVGRILWIQNTLQQAVERAARCATVNASSCGSASAVQQFAATQAAGIGVPASAFTATTPACGNQVRASMSYAYMTSLLPMPALTLSAQACFPK